MSFHRGSLMLVVVLLLGLGALTAFTVVKSVHPAPAPISQVAESLPATSTPPSSVLQPLHRPSSGTSSRIVPKIISRAPATTSTSLKISSVASPAPQAPPITQKSPPVTAPIVAATGTGGVSYDLKTVYYSVKGTTLDEIINELKNKGPRDKTGKNYSGYTDYFLEWNYLSLHSENQCATRHIEVTLSTTITLPAWEGAASSSPSLQLMWQTYLKNLSLHETGHQDIAITNAKALHAKLSSVGPRPDCSQLKSALTDASKGVYIALSDENEAYDRVTNHGFTQGVHLP